MWEGCRRSWSTARRACWWRIAEEIAGAIRRLRSDPAYASVMGAAGRQRVMENFTVDHMVRRTMEIYRQVLS
jgi:glycosyltransferase involved in cell wall biosynthesis